MNHTHSWSQGLVRTISDKQKNRGKHSTGRTGYICTDCRLVALPPKAGKRAIGYKPPE